MPIITFQLYLTDTLTEISGVSIAIWNSGNTAVIDSGVTDVSGQLVKTLSVATYNVKSFKTGYTVSDSTFVVGIVAATITIYGDAVAYGVKTYEQYREEIIDNLGGRNDTTTLRLIMSNFNTVQEYLSKKCQWEDLVFSTTLNLTNSVSNYSFANLGIENLNEIYAIRINDSVDLNTLLGWNKPLQWISPIDWDIFISPATYPIVESIPSYYTRRAKNIIFHPTLDKNYVCNIIGSLYATPVTGLSSISDFSNIDGILVNLTTSYVWLKLQESQLAADYNKLAMDLLTPYEQIDIKKRYASSQGLGIQRAFLSK